jgi:CheY-like chemotaxis protein
MANILLVDDSLSVIKKVTGLLESLGHKVTSAEDGQKGLARLIESKPRLIIVDFVMPKMNGFQFCSAVRSMKAFVKIPIILLSSRSDRVADNFVERFQISDALSKPFEDEAFIEVVQKTLGDKQKKTTKESEQKPPLEGALERDGAILSNTPYIDLAKQIVKISADAMEKTDGKKKDAVQAVAAVLKNPRRKTLNKLLGLIEAIPGMSDLRGDFSSIPLADVMQMISLQRGNGVLDVTSGGATARIQIYEGQVAGAVATGVRPEFLIGRYLVEEEYLSRQDLELLLGTRKGARLLGEQLIKLGYVSEKQLIDVLRRQTSDIMIELFRWQEGRFSFEPGASIPGAAQFERHLEVSGLVLEGLRQIDEWRLIERQIPDFGIVFKLSPERGSMVELGELTREESYVMGYIDGKRTVRDLIEEVDMGSFATCKVLYRLLTVKLIEF